MLDVLVSIEPCDRAHVVFDCMQDKIQEQVRARRTKENFYVKYFKDKENKYKQSPRASMTSNVRRPTRTENMYTDKNNTKMRMTKMSKCAVMVW